MQAVVRRSSKYVTSVRAALAERGHATNAELAAVLRGSYPMVSDTTVHRITQRLVDAKEIAMAPNDANGARRFDAQLEAHDHFECAGCGCLRDIKLSSACRDELRSVLSGCRLNGSLKIVGECQSCKTS